MATAADPGPLVEAGRVTFRLADPDKRHAAVRVWPDLGRRTQPWELSWADGTWTGTAEPEGLDRLEYRLEADGPEGSTSFADPGNPRRAEGPFGAKSVVELAGYVPPAWLGAEGPAVPDAAWFRVSLPQVPGPFPLGIWEPAGMDPEAPAPLLIVHDGLELARFSALLTFLQRMVDARRLPPLRAALLHPVDRDAVYGACPTYARRVAKELLPLLALLAPQPAGLRPVGMGASLGGLAMFHLHRQHPGSLGGLFLQSASFFQRDLDAHESSFSRFDAVWRFVDGVRRDDDGIGARGLAVRTTLTCGAIEENRPNNQRMASTLEEQGYPVALHLQRDTHNWVAWRDALDPHLVDLLGALLD